MTAREAGAGRVLVVEDDESTALFVTLVLSRNGFEAAWVMDAEQASRRLEDEPFDVLLADCRLPGRSGVDLARDTRLSRPGIGIAVMTSYAEADAELTARSNGADDFFEKPLHSSNFISRIRELVRRSRASGTRTPDSPPVRGAFAEAVPVAPAPEVSPACEASGPQPVAESGPEEQVVTRDTTALGGAHWSGSATAPPVEGTGGAHRARISAQFPSISSGSAGCEERQREHLGGGSGQADRDPLARVSNPAPLVSQVECPASQPPPSQPVLLWASSAPSTPIRSGIGPVAAPGTGPDWFTDS